METSVKIEGQAPRLPVQPLAVKTADQLESAFLSEMLKIAMPPQGSGAFGGGIGEAQFGSFMIEGHAAALATRLDLGLLARLGGTDA